MFNLIIIDDEALVLKELNNFIEWQRYGFQIVGCFSNAVNALDFIEKNSVDAVITDINLPIMDGIEFARICMEKYPDVVIGFISAYRNFEYAYAAIDMKVAGYVIKPFVEDEMVDLLKSFEKQLQNISLYNRYINETASYKFLEKGKLVECQQIFSDIMYGELNDEKVIEERLAQIGLNINVKNAHCDVITVKITDSDNYIQHIWKKDFFALCNAINSIISLKYGDFHVVPLYFFDDSFFFICIADDGEKITPLKMNAILSVMKNNLLDSLKMETTISVNNDINLVLDIVKLRTPEYLTDDVSEENIIDDALKYINQNYSKNLSIDDVADYVHLSPVYFGRYFASKTKKTFKAYLNELRIEKAKELLKDKSIKISAVAEMVGHKNLSYFYKVFSDQEGITPKQFRDEVE